MAEERLRIAGIAGSLREGSYNRMLLREAARLAPPGMEVVELDISEVPLFNEDVEREAFPHAVSRLKREIERSDGLLIATPEYNYGVPGVLKNVIDWASRPYGESSLEGVPAAVMGASISFVGTARAQLALRDSFVFTQTPVLPGPEVLVAGAQDQFDERGRLTREDTQDFVRDLLERFEVFVRRFARERAY